MDDLSYFTYSRPDYFESPHEYRLSEAYEAVVLDALPPSWHLTRSDVWLQASTSTIHLLPQGFKIHLSCRVVDGGELLRRAVPICLSEGACFKFAGDPALHKFINSKRFPRSGAGKFVTIYPSTHQSFLSLVERLHRKTEDLSGPYVLSDRRYSSSKVVFYRYGGFQRISQLHPEGTRSMLIQTPSGSLINDDRLPYFTLPPWVTDPFLEEDLAVQSPAAAVLKGRYRIDEAIAFSTTGGVYRGTDLETGEAVVLKEARPCVETWVGGGVSLDAVSALTRERESLGRLKGVSFVPELLDFFVEWEHTFLVSSFCNGVPCSELRAQEDFILLTRLTQQDAVRSFVRLFCIICVQLIEAVEAIHERGVLIGDISPANVLYDKSTQRISLIDFEGSVVSTDNDEMKRFAVRWFYPGFRREDRRLISLSSFDDYYACGMLLYNLLCPVQNIFELQPDFDKMRFLEYFVQYGFPREAATVIYKLLAGEPAEALLVARQLAHTNNATLLETT